MHYCQHPHKIWEIAKYEYCTVMKFLIWEKQFVNNFREHLTNVYGDIAPLYATIARWVAEFKRGWTASWGDHGWLLPCCWNTDDGRSTSEVLQIAREVGILYGSILNILHDHLCLGKVFEDGLHVFWRHFISHVGWKHVQNCWISAVPTQTTFCPAM